MAEYKAQYPILKDIVAEKGQEIDTIWGKRKGLGQQVVVGG